MIKFKFNENYKSWWQKLPVSGKVWLVMTIISACVLLAADYFVSMSADLGAHRLMTTLTIGAMALNIAGGFIFNATAVIKIIDLSNTLALAIKRYDAHTRAEKDFFVEDLDEENPNPDETTAGGEDVAEKPTASKAEVVPGKPTLSKEELAELKAEREQYDPVQDSQNALDQYLAPLVEFPKTFWHNTGEINTEDVNRALAAENAPVLAGKKASDAPKSSEAPVIAESSNQQSTLAQPTTPQIEPAPKSGCPSIEEQLEELGLSLGHERFLRGFLRKSEVGYWKDAIAQNHLKIELRNYLEAGELKIPKELRDDAKSAV